MGRKGKERADSNVLHFPEGYSGKDSVVGCTNRSRMVLSQCKNLTMLRQWFKFNVCQSVCQARARSSYSPDKVKNEFK